MTITPNTGYGVVDVKVDGTSVGAKTSYEFKNVVKDHTIEVVFGVTTEESFRTALSKGGTVELANNITLNSVLALTGVETTLNGNGFTLSGCSIVVFNEGILNCLDLISYTLLMSSRGQTGGRLNIYGGVYESLQFEESGGVINSGIVKDFIVMGTGYPSVRIDGGTFYRDPSEFVNFGTHQMSLRDSESSGYLWIVTEL